MKNYIQKSNNTSTILKIDKIIWYLIDKIINWSFIDLDRLGCPWVQRSIERFWLLINS